MKNFLFFGLMLLSVGTFAQDVKLKKGSVNIDGKECFKYTADLLGNHTIFKTSAGDALFFMDLLDGSGKGGSIKLYNKISVIGSDRVVTMSDGFDRREVIKGMITTGVI